MFGYKTPLFEKWQTEVIYKFSFGALIIKRIQDDCEGMTKNQRL